MSLLKYFFLKNIFFYKNIFLSTHFLYKQLPVPKHFLFPKLSCSQTFPVPNHFLFPTLRVPYIASSQNCQFPTLPVPNIANSQHCQFQNNVSSKPFPFPKMSGSLKLFVLKHFVLFFNISCFLTFPVL